MINSIYGLNGFIFGGNIQPKNMNQNNFSNLIEDGIKNIDNYQKNAENKITSFIKGEENEVHNVMIAMQEAKLSLQMAIEIRNKMIDAYHELSRIQI